MVIADTETIIANRRVFFACGVVILGSFQYGVDFGLIGGLQAMKGFLEVCFSATTKIDSNLKTVIGFRL
jgi:hypothetical protein